MSIELLERGAVALGPLLDEVVFVGGATVALWLTGEAAIHARPTNDVDVVVELSSRPELHRFEARLRDHGFRDAHQSGVICRWLHGPAADPLVVDVMPTDASLLGFANRWQAEGVVHAVTHELPSGREIAAIPPPYLVATKLEAFRGRGGGDFAASHDLEDIVTLLDGYERLVDEVRDGSGAMREYVSLECRSLLADTGFVDKLPWHLRPDPASQARLDLIVLPRLEALAALAP